MKKIFATFIINGVCLYIIDWLFAGVSLTPKALVLVSVLLWVLNLCVKPILQVISLPLTILTLGLFSFIINAIILWLSFKLIPGAYYNSFGTMILASLVLSILNTGLNEIFNK